MTVQSMTGFARVEGGSGDIRWVWELRSVNGKSLDVRARLPQGLERYEPEIRRMSAAEFRRGNLQVGLSVSGGGSNLRPVLDERALGEILEIARRIGERIDAKAPSIDGLLGIRGVLDFREQESDPEDVAARDAECLADLSRAIRALRKMREGEGAALQAVLEGHVDAIAALVDAIEADPSREAGAIRARIADQVAQLMDASRGLDPARLHMEAALLATKADLREEIDRLQAHVAATRDLLASGGPIGRRLDFLAQEFNREANTICSKSNAASITAAGLDLKVLIDQLREQIQNLE